MCFARHSFGAFALVGACTCRAAPPFPVSLSRLLDCEERQHRTRCTSSRTPSSPSWTINHSPGLRYTSNWLEPLTDVSNPPGEPREGVTGSPRAPEELPGKNARHLNAPVELPEKNARHCDAPGESAARVTPFSGLSRRVRKGSRGVSRLLRRLQRRSGSHKTDPSDVSRHPSHSFFRVRLVTASRGHRANRSRHFGRGDEGPSDPSASTAAPQRRCCWR
jgi:hypothetical protein